MLRTIVLAIIILQLASLTSALADVKQDLLAAARKLADSDNYSWTTTAQGGGGVVGGGSEGKTQRDGLTLLTIDGRDGSAQVLFKGETGAVKTPDGQWQSVSEAVAPADGDRPSAVRMLANMIKTYRPPAAQAINLAQQAQDLQKTDDGGYTGALSADGAKALMQRRISRREPAGPDAPPPDIKDPHATVTFWIDNGLLTKFQFNVQGTMTVRGEERQINRTTTVEIKDVGTTSIDVPEEAKAKMQ